MSGGSWDYAYHRIDDIASTLSLSTSTLRRAFGKHMELVAKAMRDIEWVDSGDYAEGQDTESILSVLGSDSLYSDAIMADLERVKEECDRYINLIKEEDA